MITVHIILNAHIDPVWLWPWQSGVDEVLATCHSACDRLDRHPDIIFTHGEAWTYDVVERLDPGLFRRIRDHVAAGRWEIVGGWWIQPDCNHPGANGLEMQIRLGRDYFLDRFGVFPRIGYNIDSFGHAAVLPSLLRRHGQDRYVMMRPQEHELALPARVFRWRSDPAGKEVLTFRIASNYETRDLTREHVLAAVEGLAPGLAHTMCFVGLGDHGGGPTERQIAWCREHAQAIPGCRLQFSSPSRFFDAVLAASPDLPLVTGELQHHAVGCYSVTRSVKVAVRRAEHMLEQADIMSELAGGLEASQRVDESQRLNVAWRQVCFNHFHDTLGGTSIPSAYSQAEDELGAAKACADEIMQLGLRRLLPRLRNDTRQRIVLCNAAALPFHGYAELAHWVETSWQPSWRIVDEAGLEVPYQVMPPEALVRGFTNRILIRTHIPPAGIRVLAVEPASAGSRPPIGSVPGADANPARVNGQTLAAGEVSVDLRAAPELMLTGGCRVPVQLALYEDPSDTWAHGVVRFEGPLIGRARWERTYLLEQGPLMAAALQYGAVADSTLRAEWRTYASEPVAELQLRVHWRARQQVLKLVLEFDEGIEERVDGVPGMALRRELDGYERPVRDFTLLRLAGGNRLGIVCPEVFALDSDRNALRLTLLRSPFMVHHTPMKAGDAVRAETADQGLHRFRIMFVAGPHLDPQWLERRASMLNYPLLSADWTRGMGPERER